MPIRTWLRFMIGDRQAILEIAGNRQSLFIGFLFVLSAAFAREYDQEDLLHKPGYLFIPFGVSLLASFILFAMAFGGGKGEGLKTPRLFVGFSMFLGLFWMTAPLAWLYAIPYERFLSPLDATEANLWTLGVVSLWRVALMIRVISVLMQYPPFGSIGLVMFIADIEALLGLFFLPWPLIDVMGGLMMSENEALKRSTTNAVAVLGGWTLPVWFVGFCYAMSRKNLKWQGPLTQIGASVGAGGLVKLAVSSVLIWAAVLPRTQPAVIRQSRIDQLFKEDQVAQALAEMSHLGRDAFPPMWDPPPHHAGQRPRIHLVLVALADAKSPQWITDIYVRKVQLLQPNSLLYGEDVKPMVQALNRLPGGRNVIEAWTKHDDYGAALKKRFTEFGVWPPDDDALPE